jgi:chemotaxis protein MotB
MPMKNFTLLILALSVGIGASARTVQAQFLDPDTVRYSEAALAFSSGSVQKTTPRDGIVNLITGDNQTTGNRMLLGKRDVLYLKLENPTNVAVGDLYTVYRRVRKVFHPVTREYMGFVTIRLAVVKVTDTGHALTPVETVLSYSAINPGDPVMRFAASQPSEQVSQVAEVTDLSGMIVELQADRSMTLVSQSDVVYLDRGREDGLKSGDLLDIHRHSAGLPPRKIGQLKVLSMEDRTATAKIVKATTRVHKGDRYKLVGFSAPIAQPVELPPLPPQSDSANTGQAGAASASADLLASKLRSPDASGQSRVNLGDLPNFLRYDSGEAAIKPEGYTLLDQVIEYLRSSGDTRLIRVEGHTDNVEIGPSLKSRYPSNWELSKARANGVVRYLVEKGGMDSARLSAVGYGESKPAASNAIEEGRTKNRRVEILLYAPEYDSQESTPQVPGQVQRLQSDPSTLSARGGSDQPAAPADDPKAAGAGTLSVTEPPRVPPTDGAPAANTSDTGKAASSDAGGQDTIQPAGTTGN